MNQNEMILDHLKEKGSITPLEAFNLYGCLRLSGRIYDLQKLGVKIKSKIVTNGKKHFAKYSLEK